MRNFLTFVAVALVTALTVALVAPPFIDWSARRQMVAHAVADRIGAPVEIGGPVTLRLLPTPYLQAADVTIGPRSAPWLQGKAMRFEFGLANLVAGKIRLDDIVFDHPRIRIGPDLPAPGEGRLEFGHVRAAHAEIRIERTQAPPLVLHDVNLDGAGRSATGPWRAGGDFALGDGARASFQIATDEIAADALPLKADVVAGGIRAEFDGRLGFGVSPSLAGALTLSGVVAAPGGASWPWQVTGEAVGAASEATLSHAEVRLGSQARSLEAEGRLSLRLGESPELAADLQAKTLNFDALLRGEKETSAPPARAVRVFAALAQQALRRDAPLAKYSLKLAAATAYLGARALDEPRLSLSGASDGVMQVSLESGLPGHGDLKLAGGLELGAAPIFRGHATGRVGDFATLAAWASQGEAEFGARLAALGATLPAGEISASGDLELSPEGCAARGLSLTVAKSHFDGGLVYRLASAGARARLFLDLASDTLDIDAAPNVEAGLDWLGDTDLDFRLKARRLRVARLGLASVESGSLDVRARKEGRTFSLDKLALADFGGATIEAEGETAPTGRWARVKLDAAHLSDFAALLARAAPGPASRWLLGRADDLGAAKATFEARRDGPPAPGPFPLDFLKADGVVAGSRFDLTLSRAPAPVDALSAQASLDAPDAGALLRKLGARIPPGAAGRGQLSISGTGQWDRGFEGKAHLALAGAELNWSGAMQSGPDKPWLSGPLTLKSADVMPALAALGVATPGTGAVAPADLSAALQISPGGARLSKLAGSLAGSRVAGELAFAPPPDAFSLEQLAALVQNPDAVANPAETPPTITGALDFDQASLGAFLSLALGRPGPTRPGALWSEAKFGPALLRPPSLDVAVKVGALDGAFGVGRSFSGRLRLDRDRLALDDVDVALNGGEAGGRVELRRGGGEATASGALKLQGVGFERAGGRARLDLNLDFAGSGNSAAALVGSLAGAGRLKLAEARIARLDPEALSRALARIEQSGGASLDAKTLEAQIGAELDKGPLTLGSQEGAAALSAGTLRFGPFETPTAQGTASVSGDFSLSDGKLALEATFAGGKTSRFWSGPPPSIQATVANALDSPARKLDAAMLSAGLAAEAIARESDRMENFEADVRERAMFNRRRKAELFLARREAEISAWEADRERRELMDHYLGAYEAWAGSHAAAPLASH